MSKEIKGYTAEEIAESSKKKLLEDYGFIERKRKEIETTRKVIADALVEYRRASVDRVLHYIRQKKITDEHELDILLCHCQNKLNGNIDGVEIDLH